MKKVDRDQFATAHHRGLRRDDLAAIFGISPDAVTNIRRELGLPLDKPRVGRRPVKIDREQLAELTADGWTRTELAQHFKAHRDTISRVQGELGISQKPRMTEDRLASIAGMIADGWSHTEIHRTEGVGIETLRRYFPGTAWTVEQRTAHVIALRRNGGYDWNAPRGQRAA